MKTKVFRLLKVYQPSKRVSPHNIISFLSQLSTLLKSGVSLAQGLEILLHGSKHFQLTNIIKTILNEILAGKSLSSGLKYFPKQFSLITIHLIQIGETTGTLAVVLQRIAETNEKSLKFKRKLLQAIFYPALVCVITFIVTCILLIAVVPQFTALFSTAQTTLPLITRCVIYASHFLIHYVWLIISAFLFTLILAIHLSNNSQLVEWIYRMLLKIQPINAIINKIFWCRFSHYLGVTYASGIPIITALQLLSNAFHYTIHQQAIHQLTKSISTGKHLYLALRQIAICPPLVIQMVQVGEESGTLDSMLLQVTAIYENEIEHTLTLLSQLVEPLIMVVLGVLIGGLVVAMYLPIFKLGTIT